MTIKFKFEPCFSKGVKDFYKYNNGELAYVLSSVLSIFDKKNIDNEISLSEFQAVKKEQYEKWIVDIENSYKNKSGKELTFHIPSYQELEQMLKNDKSEKKITYDELIEPIVPNGKVGQVNQGSYGNCYQIGADIALSLTEKGRKHFAQAITFYPEDECYCVTFKGAKDKSGKIVPKRYFISKKELKAAQEQNTRMGQTVAIADKYKQYTRGDADVVLFDLAMEKYRKETGYRPPSRHCSQNGGKDDVLSSGYQHEVFELITGNEGHSESYATYKASDMVEGVFKSDYVATPNTAEIPKIRKFLLGLSKGYDNVASSIAFKQNDEIKKYGLYAAHAYAISSIDFEKNTVNVINPHNGAGNGKGKETTIPLSFFMKWVDNIRWVAL